jgi:hypothetical protein
LNTTSRCHIGILLGATCLLLALTGCASQSAPPTPTDPFAAVAQQADAAYTQGMALYEQGRNREALDALDRARLLSPSDDPRITEMIERVQAVLTPTPKPNPPTDVPAAPTTIPTTVSGRGAVPTPVTVATVPPPTPPPTPISVFLPPTPPAVLVPEPTPPPVATPVPAATEVPIRASVTAVTTIVSAGPAALDVLDESDQVFLADRSGLVWTVVHGQPALERPYTVSGTPVGLAADPTTGRLYIAVRAQPPALVVLDTATGQQLATVALPGDPGDVRLDASLGMLYVLVPDRGSLVTVDVRDMRLAGSTADLLQVSGMALDEGTHTLYLSHLGGQLSVVDCPSGTLVGQLSPTSEGLSGVAFAYGRVFATNTPGRELIEINVATAEISHFALAAEPESIVVGPQSGAVYVLDRAANAIVKVNPGDGSELGRAVLGDGPSGASSQVQPDALWLRPRMAVSAVGERIYTIDPQAATLAVVSLYQ